MLGAVVSPTDPIAATAIMHRLGVPRRIVSIVEGESLVNDGTALVAYRAAVVATVSGVFSLWEAGVSFVLNVAGGIVVGLGVAWIVRQVRRRLDFPPAEVTISLLTGYFAYIPAELIGVSAVIAAVTAGIYLGWYTPELTTPEVRLMGESAWEIVTFTLNAILFTLIGLQLPGILDALDAYSAADLIWWAVAIWLTVLVAARVWVYPAAKLPRLLSRHPRARPDAAARRAGIDHLVGDARRRLAGGRAGDPALHRRRRAFPGRDLILFLTFAVIFGTLVIQGLTLPAVIRLLELEDDGEEAARDEAQGPHPGGGGRARPARGAGRRGLGAGGHGRAGPRRLRLPHEPLLVLARRRRRRRDRGPFARLPAAAARAAEAERDAVHRAAARAVRSRTRSARRVERDLDLEDARLEI